MIRLASLRAADLETMLDILTNDCVKQTYMLPDFPSREDAVPLFQKLVGLSGDSRRFVRGIYSDETLVGFLNDVEIENGAIELGYVIHPRFQGNGYATEALGIAIGELFHLGFQAVITGAFRQNAASIRVMEKNGMTRIEKTEPIDYRGKTHICVYYTKVQE